MHSSEDVLSPHESRRGLYPLTSYSVVEPTRRYCDAVHVLRAVYYLKHESSSSDCGLSQQREKFLYGQSRKFLLKAVKLAG